MKKLLSLVLCILMISQCAFAAGNPRILKELDNPEEAITLNSAEAIYSDIIVKFKSAGETSAKSIPYLKEYIKLFDNVYLVSFEDAKTAKIICDYLNSDPNVEFAHPDEEVSLPVSEETEDSSQEPEFSLSGTTDDTPDDYSLYPGEYFLDSINAKGAWEELTKYVSDVTSRSAVVAVLDSGVDIDNPDFINRFYRDSDGNIIGGRFLNDNETSFDDDYTGKHHGTSVAGAIAAEADNGTGICGVAGRFDVKIMPVKVFNKNGGSSISGLIQGISFAADNGANVINMSLGTPVYNDALQSAVNYAHSKGVTIVCSAGNELSTMYQYPACLDNVISVGSLSKTNTRSFFSQFNEYIDVTAPGEDLALTYPGTEKNYAEEGRNGTSFAAPMVSAAAALIKIANPYITPNDIEEILKATATDYGKQGHDIEYGFGKINLKDAISAAYQGYVPTSNIIVDEAMTLTINQSKQIGVTILPYNANNKAIVYSSSDTSIATVSNNGVVMGIRPGEVKISVKSNYNNELKKECTVTVLPSDLSFSNVSIDLGTNNQRLPNTNSTEFVFSSNVPYVNNKTATSYAASLNRIYKDNASTSVTIRGVNSAYQYVEYLPKNATSANAKAKESSYVFLRDAGSSGIIALAGSDYFVTETSNASVLTLPSKYWTGTTDFVALATDGSGFNVFLNNKIMCHFDVNDLTDDGNKQIRYFTLPYYVTDAIYNDDEDIYSYISVAKNDQNQPVILMSTYGNGTWFEKTYSDKSYPVFKKIIADGDYLYLLSNTDIYTLKVTRTGDEEFELSDSLTKLCDIDSAKIKSISLLTNGSSNVLAGYGANGIFAISKDGSITELYRENGKTISMAFNFNGYYWALIDNVLHKASIPSSEDYSLDDSLDIFNINLLDSDSRLISTIPDNGKVTVEYYMESKAPIEMEYIQNGKAILNKYPLQIVTSLYNADTNALIDVKRKDLTIDYYSKGKYNIGCILRWEETFNLNPDTNYKIKVMTFKGHGFLWTEAADNITTLNVFSRALEK